MPKKTTPARMIGPDWFLVEWMQSKDISQAELARRCAWSKATMNDIVHGRTEYYRAILNQIARALDMHPWELLMSPEEANQIKRLRVAVEEEGRLKLVAEKRQDWSGAPDEDAPLRRQN